MTNTIEKPIAEPVEEKQVEKEPVPEPESTTTEEESGEPEVNSIGEAVEGNGNGHTQEDSDDTVKEAKEEEITLLKRKDAPTEVEEGSPKKKKLIETDEKEPDAVAVET